MNRLDELISENAKPADILDFLENSENFVGVFAESLSYQRLFQLDFFLSCGTWDIDRLFGFAAALPASDKSLFAFQILLSDSGKAQYAKYRHRRALNDMSSALGSFNPYVHASGEKADEVHHIDNICFKACADGDILRLPDMLDEKSFLFLLENIGYSLFQHRIMQTDFMAAIGPAARDSLVAGVFKTLSPRNSWKFIKLVLGGNFDIRLKYSVLEGIRTNEYVFVSKTGESYAEMLQAGNSLQEIMLKDAISGKNELGPSFCLYLLTYLPAYVHKYIEFGGGIPPYLTYDEIRNLAGMMRKNLGKLAFRTRKNMAGKR